MKQYLKHKIFKILKETISREKLEAYVIGGFVRDIIMNRPSKDIDIVVVGSGIKLAERVRDKLGLDVKISVFKRFGTAMIRYKDTEIEFVGARKESYQEDSRKPIVEEGSLQDDQNRRDFTINALAISLSENNYGKLTDPFGGIRDIENKIIRTPLEPDITFSDDPLRIMRAIRFASQLNFEIHPQTFTAIKKNKDRIKIVSKERINDELNKIIMSPVPSKGFKLLDKSGILEIIFPELHNLKGVEKKEAQTHKDNFIHTIQVLDNISEKTNNLWLRWAALLHDIGKPKTKKFTKEAWTFHGHEYVGFKMVPAIFKKMKLPLNEKMKYIGKLVKLHLRPISLVEDTVTDSAVRRLLFDAGDIIDDLMILCKADITSKNEKKVSRYIKNFELVKIKLKEIEEKDKIRNWQPPITGDIIMKTFDMKPSKDIGIIKDAIKDAILDGIIPNNYDSAYNLMIKEGEKLGYKKK